MTAPSKSPGAILKCAANLANNYSIAGVLGLNNQGFQNFTNAHPDLGGWISDVGNAFLGNTFPGFVGTFNHFSNGEGGGIVHDIELGGLTQGIPARPGWAGGVSGAATEAGINAVSGAGSVLSGVTGAATSLGEEGLAGPVGWAKFGIDGAIFAGAVAYCTNHP